MKVLLPLFFFFVSTIQYTALALMDTEFTEIPLLFKSLYDTIYKDISD
jgi:hypothetical protein